MDDTDKMPSISLIPSDIVGAIERMGKELNAYTNQHVSRIDPAIIMAYLERMAHFAQALPKQQAADEEVNEGRVN